MNELFNNIYRGRRVLVTGHTGFKGSWLCMLLHQLGAEVIGYALAPNTTPSLYEVARVDELVQSEIGDIRDYAALLATLQRTQPELVIHMAAQPLVRLSYEQPIETYATNVMGTLNLLEAIRHTPSVRAIINVTTDKCYENREWHWGYRENEPMGGFDPYSNSKACSELVTAAYRSSYFNPAHYDTHKVAVATARAGNVIGGGDWALDRLIPDFMRSMERGEKLQIRSPYAIRPWQHVLEPLSGYLQLGQHLLTNGAAFAQAWNFGPNDSDARPVAWISEELCNLWGNDASFEVDKQPQVHEATYLKLDCSKAKAELGWTPRWSLETTLSQIVAWHKAMQRNENMRDITYQQIQTFFKH